MALKFVSFGVLLSMSAFLPYSLACSDCKPDCSVNKYKCAYESPLCARLEPLCENFFFSQWKDMRCACPKTCKLCSDDNMPMPIVPEIEASTAPAIQAPTRCDPQRNPIDVVFVLDGSSSITRTIFDNQLLGFVKNFARDLAVSPNGHRLGVLQYSSGVRIEFNLDQYSDSNALETAIDNIRYMGGGTRTGMGIQRARSMFDFTSGRQSTKACIVLTDGVSSDRVEDPANQLRQLGVNMVAIGVGQDYNRAELEQIAGNSSHVFTVDTFQNLNGVLAEQLNTMICSDAVNQ